MAYTSSLNKKYYNSEDFIVVDFDDDYFYFPTNIIGFRESNSSIILIFRAGISRPVGNFPESLSQALSVGTMLVGRLGVHTRNHKS